MSLNFSPPIPGLFSRLIAILFANLRTRSCSLGSRDAVFQGVKLFWLPILLTCLLSAPAISQQLPLRHYGQLEGLDNLQVTALAQDGKGYLWVGTVNGLYRFDGERFRRFSQSGGIPAIPVAALHTDQYGDVWVGTRRGMCRIEGAACRTVHTREGTVLPVGIGQHFASFGSDQLLVVSGDQLWRVQAKRDGEGLEATPFFGGGRARSSGNEEVSSIATGHDGDFWMGCGPRVCHYSNGELRVFGHAQGVPTGGKSWPALLLDGKGELWCRSSTGMMMSLPPGAGRFIERRPAPLGGDGIIAPVMTADLDGRLVTSNGFGLLRGSPGNWQAIGEEQGFNPDDEVSALLMDRDGDLWIGIAGRGLVHWQGYRQWESWSTRQGLPSNTVWSFLRANDGALLVGTGQGAAKLDPVTRRFIVHPIAAGADRTQWSSMVEDRSGNVWASSFSGLLLRKLRSGGRFEVVAKLPMIQILLVDSGGNLWICTEQGLYRLENGANKPRLVSLSERMAGVRTESAIRAACQTALGVQWFIADGVLLRHVEGHWSRPQFASSVDMKLIDLSCDENSLLLTHADETKVWWVDADALAPQLSSRTFDLANSPLKGRTVQSTLIDSRRWLWVGTEGGIGVWNGRGWRVLNQQSGLIWNDTSQHALYEDLDGSVWIGTSNGVSHLSHPEELFTLRPQKVLIDSVTVDDAPQATTSFSVPWSKGTLAVKLAVLSFQNYEGLRYRYFLRGLDHDWSITESSELRYTALAPGSYVLKVMAENIVTQTSSPVEELTFTVMPPWWQSYWFYAAALTLMIGATAGLSVALSRWRWRKMLLRQREMEALVQQRTQELEVSREEHRQRSLRDSLTQIWNRAAIMDLITRQIAETQASGRPFLLVLLDLDHFKRINDTYGHLAGDAVLKEFVRRTQERLRDDDALGRYGGEEFLLLLPGLDANSGRRRLNGLHLEVCAAPMEIGEGGAIDVTCSFGVATGAGNATAESLIQQADMALYRAKENGRNRIEYG